MYERDFEKEALLFKALGDPARLKILATLARADHEVCVCDFTSGLDVNQPTVSHHLRILKEAGLITSVRRGTWSYYSLSSEARDQLEVALVSVIPECVNGFDAKFWDNLCRFRRVDEDRRRERGRLGDSEHEAFWMRLPSRA